MTFILQFMTYIHTTNVLCVNVVLNACIPFHLFLSSCTFPQKDPAKLSVQAPPPASSSKRRPVSELINLMEKKVSIPQPIGINIQS